MIAVAQFTIVDLNDITPSNTEPTVKAPDMLWLDTSVYPSKLKKWNGVTWEPTGASSLEELDPNASEKLDDLKDTAEKLVTRVTNAEEKITDDSIIQTVTRSNTYKSYNLIPNKRALELIRNGLALNPLHAYNFISGDIFQNNTLVSIENSGITDIAYTSDLQIIGGEIIIFDKPATRIETTESNIKQQADKISLVVKDDGTVDGSALVAAINISPSKINMSALNIDLSGYVTFTSLNTPGATVIDGGNIKTNTISFNTLLDKPFIPTQYTNSEALEAWKASGYATYIDSQGAYIGVITANKVNTGKLSSVNGFTYFDLDNNRFRLGTSASNVLMDFDGSNLILGPAVRMSWSQIDNKPTIPAPYTDQDALDAWISSGYKTYIDSNGIYTGTVATQNLRGDVINFNNGIIDSQTNGFRFQFNSYNYVIVRNGNIGFYVNGVQTAEIRSDGVYEVINGVAHKLSGGGAAVFS